MTLANVITIGVALLAGAIALFTFFHQSVLTYTISRFVFDGKLFGEPKYGRDAIAQIIRIKNRSAKTVTDVVLKSKTVGSVIDIDVEDNGFIGNSDVTIADAEEHAEWHLTLKMMPPQARVSIAVLSNGLMHSGVLTGGNSSTVIMHELEFRYRRNRRVIMAVIVASVVGALGWAIKYFST